jgi:predicted nucleotidyltransferase
MDVVQRALRANNTIRDRLLSRLPDIPDRIVMQGSCVRGQAGKDSDGDVLVIVEDCSPSVVEERRSVCYDVRERIHINLYARC